MLQSRTAKISFSLTWMFSSVILIATPSLAMDCKKASTKMERKICASSSLMELDRKLGVAYREAARYCAALPAKDDEAALSSTLKEEQRTWLKVRDECKDDKCIESAYKSRIEVLSPQLTETPAGTLAILKLKDGDGRNLTYAILWKSKAASEKITSLGTISQFDDEPFKIKLDAARKTLEFSARDLHYEATHVAVDTLYVVYWGEASPLLAGFTEYNRTLTVNGADTFFSLNGNEDFTKCSALYEASAKHTLCEITDEECLKKYRAVSPAASKLRPTVLGVELGGKTWKLGKPISVACEIIEEDTGQESLTFSASVTARFVLSKFESNPPRALLELKARAKPDAPERSFPLSFKLLTKELVLP